MHMLANVLTYTSADTFADISADVYADISADISAHISADISTGISEAASADIYYKAGQTEKADKMLQEIGDDAFELVRYYSKSSGDDWKGVGSEKRENLTILRDIGPLANQHNRSELGKKYTDLYNQVNTAY